MSDLPGPDATPAAPSRIFLLSPASLGGVRGGRILRGESGAPFMEALRAGGTAPLGEVYAFISSLYYRGKRAYARRFGRAGEGEPAALAITPTRGLVPDGAPVSLDDLREFAATDIDPEEPAYVRPLLESARALRGRLDRGAEVVLLGSIASGKYLDPLARVFEEALLVPSAFVGRGDMSRGGLMLRRVEAGEELDYVPARETERRGERPPRLSPT